jgi:hypothetical protein
LTTGKDSKGTCPASLVLTANSRGRRLRCPSYVGSREIAVAKQTKTLLERIMKNSTLHLCLASLLSLILLACPAAYGQLTPSGDSYTNTAASTTNYGAKTLLDVESSQTTFIQFDLSSIPSGYTSADITKATLKLYVNVVTTAGSFNVDYVNGTWTESTIDASNAPALIDATFHDPRHSGYLHPSRH